MRRSLHTQHPSKPPLGSGLFNGWPHLQTTSATTARERLLKPRTPADCRTCRWEGATAAVHPLARIPVTPWRERKSRRGAPKRILSQGFACPNRTCLYYQITDGQIHARVGDRTHGQHERIQTLRCQACGTTFSTRRTTPLYRLKTTSHRVAEVLTALAEGLSVSAAVRVFGHRHATITTWLTRAGAHSATLHDHFFHNLTLRIFKSTSYAPAFAAACRRSGSGW
jgi:transposase-like protein